MDLTIFTEWERNPFRRTSPPSGEFTNGRRFTAPVALRAVMGDLLRSLGFSNYKARVLEIGPGTNYGPSAALSDIGASVTTLNFDVDTDVHEVLLERMVADHSNIPLAELGHRMFGFNRPFTVPIFGGVTDGVFHYVGDAAFVADSRGDLGKRQFDLVYYFGSIFGNGFNASIRAHSRETGVSYEQRLLSPIHRLEEDGYMVAVSGFMNKAGCPTLEPATIPGSNQRMADVALDWLRMQRRTPVRVIFYGLTPQFAQSYLEREGRGEEWAHRPFTVDAIQAALREPVIDQAHNRGILTPAQVAAINELGIVDAVAVQYK